MSLPIRREARLLTQLALPLILAQLAQIGMGFIDTVMVGRLGSEALAGIALGNTIYMFVNILASGVLLAVSPLTSQAHGAGRKDEAARPARQGIWLALFLTLPSFVFFQNARPLLSVFGQEPTAAALAAGYLAAVSWGFLPTLILTALRSFLEGISDTRPIFWVMLVGLGANVVLNQALMFGRWGFPELGLVGTGYSTSIVFSLMVALFAAYIALQHRHYRLFRTLRRPDPTILRELVSIGVPIGLTLGFESGLFTVTAILMGTIGSAELAAHQIALQSASITFMVPMGLGIATSVRVGQAVGRGDTVGAQRAGYVGMALSTVVMGLSAILFWQAPHFVIGFYIDPADPANGEVVRHAARFLALAAAFQIFDGLQVSASGALRGLKDTRVPMVLSLVAYWLVGVTSGILLAFPLGLHGPGLWIGLVIGLATAAILLVGRFRKMACRALDPEALA